MSNATDTPRKSGQRRRRRSRGGQNRNNNPNSDSPKRTPSNSKGSGNAKAGGRTRRPRTRRQPVKLTWWQKLLKAVGLYKAPSRGKGPKPKSEATPEEITPREPKSNTRNARGREPGSRKESSRGERRRGGDPSTVESARVYVGNLSYEATEQDIKELFKGVGTVRRVEIVYNRNTHRSKGYGFVEMMNKDDAMRSVEVLHDQPFMGRNMTVSGAKSKAQEEDEDMESAAPIKASDVELAPLPDAAPEASGESAEVPAEEVSEPEVQEAPADGNDEPASEEQPTESPKQD